MKKIEPKNFKELKSIIGRKKLYEVCLNKSTLSVTDNEKFFDIKSYFKNGDFVHYICNVGNSNDSPIFGIIRSVFGEDSDIIAYCKDYSGTDIKKKMGEIILEDYGNGLCVSDKDCMYVVGVDNSIKNIPEKIGDIEIFVNEFSDIEIC